MHWFSTNAAVYLLVFMLMIYKQGGQWENAIALLDEMRADNVRYLNCHGVRSLFADT
jgi:pentatricopeptide repeat protein